MTVLQTVVEAIPTKTTGVSPSFLHTTRDHLPTARLVAVYIHSWPDLVLRRLQANPCTTHVAVLNQAAGGNRVLNDGLGPNVLARLDRDVLAQSGVKYVMLFEGVNDIGTAPATADAQRAVGDRLIQAYQQVIARVHTVGLPVFAATITPFGAPNDTIQPYSDPVREATRQRVNAWIKGSGAFDAVVDFAEVVADPGNATRLASGYDSGDFLHPNVEGYEAMARAFPVGVFERYVSGVSGF